MKKMKVEKSKITHNFHTFRKLWNPILWCQMLHVECFQMSVLSCLPIFEPDSLYETLLLHLLIPFEIWRDATSLRKPSLYIRNRGLFQMFPLHFVLTSKLHFAFLKISFPPQCNMHTPVCFNSGQVIWYGVDLWHIYFWLI